MVNSNPNRKRPRGASYLIDTPRGREPATGEPAGRYLAVRKIGTAWSVDHRPTGRRVCRTDTRAQARAIARILARDVGDALGTAEHDTVVRAIVQSPAWADLVAVREGCSRALAQVHPAFVAGRKRHGAAKPDAWAPVDPVAFLGGAK
jgi:hypothetical protein